MVKRNFNYSVGDIEYSLDGTKLVCKVAGTTGLDPLIIPSEVAEVIDGTVTWKLMNYAEIDYSLDEKKIGTWVDGKPLYQRTFESVSPSVDALVAVVDLESNIYPYKVEGCIIDKNGSYIPIPLYWTSTAGVGIYVNNNEHKVYMRLDSSTWGESPCYITLQYTKTTD